MKFQRLSSYCRRVSKGPSQRNNAVDARTEASVSEPTRVLPEHQGETLPSSKDLVDYLAQLKQVAGEGKLEIDRQPNSIFFSRLPSEIKNQIYEDFVRFSQTFCPVCETRHLVVCQGSPMLEDDAKQNPSILSVLLVCRRFYFEIINILYSSTTFHIPGLYNMRRFFSTVPRPQLQNIRSLQLMIRLGHKFIKPDGAVGKRHRPDHPWRLYELDWLNIWRLISILPNLQNLRVTFLRYEHSDRRMFEEFPPNNPEKITAASILDPMMSSKTAENKNFVVEIHDKIFKRDQAFKTFLDELEGREPRPPFVVRKLEGFSKDEGLEAMGGYRVWHAPEAKYAEGLQVMHAGERWGDPEEYENGGEFRSDRCVVGV